MDIQEIVKMYNVDGKNLTTIGEEIGSSKSSISRYLKENGWTLDRKLKQYVQQTEIQLNNETSNTGNKEFVNHVPRETIKTVKCTFELPSRLAKALKIKSAVEGVKMVKLVEKILTDSIESKYFDIK